MTVALYQDVHVPLAISEALRRRGVDVLTAIEDGADQLADDALLERAHQHAQLLFTQDIRFQALAHQWQLYRHPLILLTGAGALVKITLEIMSGQAIFTQTTWPSVPASHAVGLLGGLVVAAAQTILCRSHLYFPVTGSRQ